MRAAAKVRKRLGTSSWNGKMFTQQDLQGTFTFQKHWHSKLIGALTG